MKPITAIAVLFLVLLAALQLTRLLMGWEVMVNGVLIPVWVSGIAAAIAAGLAVMLWRRRDARAEPQAAAGVGPNDHS